MPLLVAVLQKLSLTLSEICAIAEIAGEGQVLRLNHLEPSTPYRPSFLSTLTSSALMKLVVAARQVML